MHPDFDESAIFLTLMLALNASILQNTMEVKHSMSHTAHVLQFCNF